MSYLNEAGTFTCIVTAPTAGWFGESEKKGTPFLRIPLEVSEGEHAGETIVCERYITDNTIDRLTKDLCEAFGWDGDLAALESKDGTIPDGFTGKHCSIVTEGEDFEGKTYYKVKWINSLDFKPEQMATEKVKSLMSKFGSRTRAIAKAAMPSLASKPAPKPPVDHDLKPEEDDIPF